MQQALREWLAAAYTHYSTTNDWPDPPPRYGRFAIPNDRLSRVILTAGQVVAFLALVSTLISAGIATFYWLVSGNNPLPAVEPPVAWLLWVLGTLFGLAFWLAAFVAFDRAKWVTRLVECQRVLLARGFGEPGATDGFARYAPDELVVDLLAVREQLGGWVQLVCETRGQRVPELNGWWAAEVRRADGGVVRATIVMEEEHARRIPGRVAFSLGVGTRFEDLVGGVEVRLIFQRQVPG